jgi:hypothetical protein
MNQEKSDPPTDPHPVPQEQPDLLQFLAKVKLAAENDPDVDPIVGDTVQAWLKDLK